MKCILIFNGDIQNSKNMKNYIKKDDFVICTDGALDFCHSNKIKPNIIIGDMDSVSKEILKKYKHTKIFKFPTKKDYTDSDLALKYAANHFTNIVVFGGIGSRLDHSLNNVFLPLQFLNKNIKCTFVCRNNIFRIVSFRENIIVKKNQYKYISFLPITKTVTFNNSYGLKYPLDEITLKLGRSIGISNEIIKNKCFVNIKKGVALVVLSKD